MSIAAKDIFKLLNDLSSASDRIIEEDSDLGLPRVLQWVSLVRNKAESIVESENATESLPEEMPSLMTFLKGGTSARGPRVSTVLTEFRKSHVVRKARPSIKARKSRQSSTRTPLQRRSGVKDTDGGTFLVDSDLTPKLKIPPTIMKKAGILKQNVGSSTSFDKTPLASLTPVIEKAKKRISKRKSSMLLENVKIAKMDDSRYLESMPSTKVLKLWKAKNSSLLPNYANVSVLKENRLIQSETKQQKAIENRKNMLAQRQLKMQQTKRAQEEKEKARKERMKLEGDKLQQLRSAARGKTRINSSKESTPKTVTGNEGHGEASNSKNSKDKEKQTSGSVKKMQLILNKTGSSVLKSGKAPIKKNMKLAAEKREMEGVMNTTYTTNPTSTSNKEESSKETKIDTKSGTMTNASKSFKTVKPVIEQQQQLINSANSSTSTEKKGPESYAITPTRSSLVSYDISEIRSDSDDEEPDPNSKPIPAWAVGVRLRNTLLRQHHNPIDTDKLFGNHYEPPDLAAIMGVKKKHYSKRTSSAIWNTTFRE